MARTFAHFFFLYPTEKREEDRLLMIHFLLALNIRGQVRLFRFYRPVDAELDGKISSTKDKVGKIPKPLFRETSKASKPTDSNPLLARLVSRDKSEITRSNSTGTFEKKTGIERAKSWNVSQSSSSSVLIDLSDQSSETLSHSVSIPSDLLKNEAKKQPSNDSVDLIGLWETAQEEGQGTFDSSRSASSTIATPHLKNNGKKLENKTQKSFKKHFIPYRLCSNLETASSLTPATKAFIDQIYAQVVSKDYQNSPNFMIFKKYKIVFRRYANLYFILGVDMDDDEFSMLEWIHLWMEVMSLAPYCNLFFELALLFFW